MGPSRRSMAATVMTDLHGLDVHEVRRRPSDSRGSDRPKASRGGERRPAGSGERVLVDEHAPETRGSGRPKASRGGDRRRAVAPPPVGGATWAGDAWGFDGERIVIEDRPSESRGSERPKASRGAERGRRPDDGERPKASRGVESERPKASRGEGGADRMAWGDEGPLSESLGSSRSKAMRGGEHRAAEGEHMSFEDQRRHLDQHRGGERPKASRGNDRAQLSTRGGDRSKASSRMVSAEPERRKSAEADEQPMTMTLEDWFSNPSNQLPTEHVPPQTSFDPGAPPAPGLPLDPTLESPHDDSLSADKEVMYIEEQGLGMRVSSAFGKSRGDQEGTNNSMFAQPDEFTRVPSDRQVRLAERLAFDSDDEDDEPTDVDRTASPPELGPQRPIARKSDDPPQRPVSRKEPEKKEVRKRSPTVMDKKQTVSAAVVKKSTGSLSLARIPVSGTTVKDSSSTAKSSARRPPRSTATDEIRPPPSRPMTKESSQIRVKKEPSRLSTSRSNLSTASSSVRKPPATRQLGGRLATAQTENSRDGNVPVAENGKDAAAEKSKFDVGNKTVRPGTSIISTGDFGLMNMKILNHALRTIPKLKSSPLARAPRPTSPRPSDKISTATSVSAMLTKIDTGEVTKKRKPWNPSTLDTLYSPFLKRPTSPRPPEKISTATSASAMMTKMDTGDAIKKRPPWNPSTLDTLYSPRKPDTKEDSPGKGRAETARTHREATSSGDAAPVDAAFSGRSTARSTRGDDRAKGAGPPRTGAQTTGSVRVSGSKASGASIMMQPAPEKSSKPVPIAVEEGNAEEVKAEVKMGVTEESATLMVDPFAIGGPGPYRRRGSESAEDTPRTRPGSREQVDRDRLSPRSVRISRENSQESSPRSEIYIPPEFQNLDRPVTRRDERPGTRRDDRPGTRNGQEHRPGTRSGVCDRPTTRGHEMRLRPKNDPPPEAVADDGEFDLPQTKPMSDPEYDEYYARIRAELAYDDDAFESDAESVDDYKYQKIEINSPDGGTHGEYMLLDQSDSGSEAEENLFADDGHMLDMP